MYLYVKTELCNLMDSSGGSDWEKKINHLLHLLGPVHTNPFSNENELFCSIFKKIWVHTYRFRIVFARPHYNAVSV